MSRIHEEKQAVQVLLPQEVTTTTIGDIIDLSYKEIATHQSEPGMGEIYYRRITFGNGDNRYEKIFVSRPNKTEESQMISAIVADIYRHQRSKGVVLPELFNTWEQLAAITAHSGEEVTVADEGIFFANVVEQLESEEHPLRRVIAPFQVVLDVRSVDVEDRKWKTPYQLGSKPIAIIGPDYHERQQEERNRTLYQLQGFVNESKYKGKMVREVNHRPRTPRLAA